MDDKIEQAISIAIEVSRRRAGGEEVSDEEVLQDYPHLSPYLQQQLDQLQRMDDAKAGAKPDPVDLRFTTVVNDVDDDEDEEQTADFGTADGSREIGPLQREKIDRTVPFRPSLRPAMAVLQLYHDDQRNFESVLLRSDRTVIGRRSGDVVINHDSLISTEHAEITRIRNNRRWEWHLRDLDSTNGSFVKIEGGRLKDGTELIMGSQHYRFSLAGEEARLEHLVRGDVGDSMPLHPEGTWVGRDKHEQMGAFWDPLLDSKHAFIQVDRTDHWYIKNAKSLNGVWYRVSEVKLFRTCYFQLGEQRFGFTSV